MGSGELQTPVETVQNGTKIKFYKISLMVHKVWFMQQSTTSLFNLVNTVDLYKPSKTPDTLIYPIILRHFTFFSLSQRHPP